MKTILYFADAESAAEWAKRAGEHGSIERSLIEHEAGDSAVTVLMDYDSIPETLIEEYQRIVDIEAY